VGPEHKHVVLDERESLTVRIGDLHTFANERDQPSLIAIETVPAGGVVKAFQLAYGVANDRGAAEDGLPKNPLVRLVFIRLSEGYLPGVPLIIQKSVLALATFVARLSGVERRLRKYFNEYHAERP
jgi:hypothetical protein